jgi:hypothetical protein
MEILQLVHSLLNVVLRSFFGKKKHNNYLI